MNAPIVATASQGNHFALLDKAGHGHQELGRKPHDEPELPRHRDRLCAGRNALDRSVERRRHGEAQTSSARSAARYSRSRPAAAASSCAPRTRCASTPTTGTLVSTIHTAADHATLSPDGLGVATAKGSVAQLWDATTGKLLHTLTRPPLGDHRARVLPERPRARDGQLRPHRRRLERAQRTAHPPPDRPLLRDLRTWAGARTGTGSSPRASTPPASGTPRTAS